MPYTGPTDPKLPPAVRKLPKALREVWLRVFNENSDADEAQAFRQSWAAVRHIQSAKAARIVEHQDMDDIRVWLLGDKAKTEDGHKYAAAAYLFVPDEAQPSGWRLRIEETPGVVTVAQLGRAAAALGPGFRGQTVSLPASARRTCAQKLVTHYRTLDVPDAGIPDYLFALAGLPHSGTKELAFATGFKTVQQADGRYRWVMLSSGAFEDRDGEIVSADFLESALAFAEEYDYRGTLNIWHVKGSDIGTCDGQWLVGQPPLLLETGLFDETPAGQKAAQYYTAHAAEKGGSIELYASFAAETGVWMAPGVILRRSILPAAWAAFPWSSLAVKEHKMSKKRAEVVAEFAGMLDITPDAAEKVLTNLEAGAKQLADYGVRWKAADEAPETAAIDTAAQVDNTVVATEPATPLAETVVAAEPVVETLDAVAAEPGAPTVDGLEVVITPDTLDQIVAAAVTAIEGKVTATLETLAARLEAVVATITTMGEQQLHALAATKELQDTVTRLQTADDAKVQERIRQLPRATVKALQPPAVRPTQRDPVLDQAEATAESMLDRAHKTLYGDHAPAGN